MNLKRWVMTRIKLCGITKPETIEIVNELKPDYIGFVLWPKSSRYVNEQTTTELKSRLDSDIQAVGVFVDEEFETVAGLLQRGVIDIAQLHGHEDEEYINKLKSISGKEVIRAFKIREAKDLEAAAKSSADYILLDAGMGNGVSFDWKLLEGFDRPYILAGGLSCENAEQAVEKLHPFGVDVSSGIESNGVKDEALMRRFAEIVRKDSSGLRPSE